MRSRLGLKEVIAYQGLAECKIRLSGRDTEGVLN